MRRFLGPLLALLAGFGWELTGWENEGVGIALLAVAGIWGVLEVPLVRRRRPTLHAGRRRGRFALLEVAPPERGGRRRLRRETFTLTREIHEFLKTEPPSFSEALTTHAVLMAASTEEERNAAWAERNARIWQRMQEEHRQLAQLFGDKVTYLLSEYRRRGMLSESDASMLDWYMQSNHWAPNAANALGALARRL
jgi:hypothetical protein